MDKRLEYVDEIKGFAIVLMVMGHVLAWMFPDYRVMVNVRESPALLWNIIYSFHMPLFVFMSGYLFGFKRFADLNEYLRYGRSKAVVFLVPFVCAGVLLHCYYGVVFNLHYKWLTYWYLLTLFMLILVFGLIFTLTGRIHNEKARLFVDACCAAVGWVCFYGFLHHVYMPLCSRIPGFRYAYFEHFVGLYFYFFAGTVLTRYKWKDSFARDNWPILFTIACLLWCAWFCGMGRLPFGAWILPWAGIFASFLFFRYKTESCGVVWNWLCKFGRISMSIYVFHFFFRVPFRAAGGWLVDVAEQYGCVGRFLSIPAQFAVSLVMSIAITMLCIAVDSVIRKIPYVRTLLIGVRR